MIHQPIEPAGATSRFLSDFAKAGQPTIAESIVRTVHAMPIGEQIKLVQSITNGRVWFEMSHIDADRMEAALSTFAEDMAFAAAEEDLRVHGHRVIA